VAGGGGVAGGGARGGDEVRPLVRLFADRPCLGGSELGGSVPLPVGVPVSIGRKGCDVIVSHKKVSSTHALLTATAAGAALPERAKREVASRGRLRRVRWLLLGSPMLEESSGTVQNLGEPTGRRFAGRHCCG